jgi:hypothetical protein
MKGVWRVGKLGLGLTNAQKGLISTFISAVLSLIVAFGVDLSGNQVGAIIAAVNAGLALWIGLTASSSPALQPGANALTGGRD